ncbi:N-acetylmannosamine-6-phosphate 2-epimerase [Spirulina sp. CCNP1310]|uniref:N-acetylmannosamine-6-phosphate 2-epimerase n=1 Tax=Spirulina sp. CCNP1310 TaxID=3110249 RepID=UPI002B1FBD59|nr:N-acetylmannosamine-6-phosphate 2-epimerase [Spirulina sp. CCNP1310]MEA5419810.1 N-acetylmannosamine-6-phosphate 2-epimerase [Spirulina sp. CCNP1310]
MLSALRHQLIVSCQAPADSPLHQPEMIAAIAAATVNQGAAGVRIDTPAHIRAVRQRLPEIPIIGLWKQVLPDYPVYITPRIEDAIAVIEAGADIVAIDATERDRCASADRPVPLGELIQAIHDRGKLVMADIDSLSSAAQAVALGADLVGTTLYGYTELTHNQAPPAWELLGEIAAQLDTFTICEGGVATPEMVCRALNNGADAVVVGTAITGIDLRTQAFLAGLQR